MVEQLELQSPVKKEKGIWAINGFDAGKIGNLLAEKHKDDVFIPECKNGETWGARDLLKLDAWVLKRSYSPLSTIGYEVKVSRQDFENDQKWVGYLDLCHYFYFVCPGGLIRSFDLPKGIGLIWVSSTGNLHTKVKAERRNPNPENQNRLLIYALMARSKIVSNMNEVHNKDDKPRPELVKEFIKRAEDDKAIYYLVKGHIRKIWDEIKKQDSEFSRREDRLKHFEEHLAKLGITWDSTKDDWQDSQRIENAIDKLKGYIDIWTLRNLRTAGKNMIEAADAIEKFYNDGKQG